MQTRKGRRCSQTRPDRKRANRHHQPAIAQPTSKYNRPEFFTALVNLLYRPVVTHCALIPSARSMARPLPRQDRQLT